MGDDRVKARNFCVCHESAAGAGRRESQIRRQIVEMMTMMAAAWDIPALVFQLRVDSDPITIVEAFQ